MSETFSYDGKELDLSFMPKIIDCFIFYNELEMLLYRLEVLNGCVDFFVLVESTRTHTGNIKPLFYNENKERFKKYNDKIIHIIVDDMIIPDISKDEQWKNENYQRDCINRGIRCLGLKQTDYIIISDLDEIPNPRIIDVLKDKQNNDRIDFLSLKQDFYYYNLNYKINEVWVFPKVVRYDFYLKNGSSPQKLRMMKSEYLVEKGGWHLSYFGNSEFIKNKLINFTHQEFNNSDIVDISNLQQRIDNGLDILNRPGIQLERIPISENKFLPPLYDKLLSKFILF
jgi:beta-1,4-mannosyl-glycoprotein beta-1,4-N-acetylglucosaminyltransferase